MVWNSKIFPLLQTQMKENKLLALCKSERISGGSLTVNYSQSFWMQLYSHNQLIVSHVYVTLCITFRCNLLQTLYNAVAQ
jgi:hypothetical protein